MDLEFCFIEYPILVPGSRHSALWTHLISLIASPCQYSSMLLCFALPSQLPQRFGAEGKLDPSPIKLFQGGKVYYNSVVWTCRLLRLSRNPVAIFLLMGHCQLVSSSKICFNKKMDLSIVSYEFFSYHRIHQGAIGKLTWGFTTLFSLTPLEIWRALCELGINVKGGREKVSWREHHHLFLLVYKGTQGGTVLRKGHVYTLPHWWDWKEQLK